MIVNNSAFCTAIKNAGRFLKGQSNDVTWLNFIWCWSGGEYMRVGACNGHSICVTKLEMQEPEEFNFSLEPAVTADLFKVLPAKAQKIVLKLHDAALYAEAGGVSIAVPCDPNPNGEYSLKGQLEQEPLSRALGPAVGEQELRCCGIPIPMQPFKDVLACFPKTAQVFMDYVPYISFDSDLPDRGRLLYRFYSFEDNTPTVWTMPMRSADVPCWEW